MANCKLSKTCAFFLSYGGYSPELNEVMKAQYCNTDCTDCARFKAVEAVGRENVPAGLLPTDHERVASLSAH